MLSLNTSAKRLAVLTDGQPVISVDTKEKELVGNFKNAGREWRPKGRPEEVNVHDFIDPKLKRAVPYGVYDINNNTGWVSVGTDHDTAAFAVNAIRRWWTAMGKKRYPKPKGLLVTADGGGSNGYRVRLWKIELQKLADELKFPITVCHLPPGTSKWNKIEHRLFSFITINWRALSLTGAAYWTTDSMKLISCRMGRVTRSDACPNWSRNPSRRRNWWVSRRAQPTLRHRIQRHEGPYATRRSANALPSSDVT
jgi:hypothetical protein